MLKPAKPCFSMREHLYNQGVTSEEAIRGHMAYVYFMERFDPLFGVRNYRVNPNTPNVYPVPSMG